MVATHRRGLSDALEAELPHVPVPTIVMRGERDPLVTQHWAEEATALLPSGQLIVMPDAAHTLTYNSPEALANVVRSVL